MSLSANVCGNCANFKPKQGEKFFNCTYAQQGGVKYAMQVRADTRSCDAFSALKQPTKPPVATQSKPPPPAKRTEPRRPGLCPWGRLVMLAAIAIIILLIAWGAYTCYSGRGTPAPTPTPTPTVPPTPGSTPAVITPSPTPTPLPIFQYNLGDWVTQPPLLMLASSAEKKTSYNAPGPITAPFGSSWIIVTVSITNGGSEGIPVSALYFKLVSSSGLSFPAVRQPLLFMNPYPYDQAWLTPGSTVSGRIVYLVPEVVTSLSLQVYTTSGYVQWLLPW